MDTKPTTSAQNADLNGYIEGDIIDVISDEEAREIFDETAQRLLGISGDEFLRRYDRGDYHGQKDEDIAVVSMEMILPLVRHPKKAK